MQTLNCTNNISTHETWGIDYGFILNHKAAAASWTWNSAIKLCNKTDNFTFQTLSLVIPTMHCTAYMDWILNHTLNKKNICMYFSLYLPFFKSNLHPKKTTIIKILFLETLVIWNWKFCVDLIMSLDQSVFLGLNICLNQNKNSKLDQLLSMSFK